MRGRVGQQARAWFILGRVSNLPTVWTNVLAAWVLAGGGGDLAGLSSAALVWMLLGASLLYVGGTTLNDFFDVAFDEKYRRERPIPSRTLSRASVGVASLLYFTAGSLVIVTRAHGAWPFVVCLVASIIFYDYRHKQWVGSVAVMGACRFFLILLAASSVSRSMVLPPPVWIYAVSVFAYIVGLTLTARGESRHASPEGWHSLFLLLPVGAALWLAPSFGDWLVFIALAIFVILVIGRSLQLLRRREHPDRIGQAVGWMLAGICLLDASFLAAHGWALACFAALGFVLACALQRVVPAT